MQISEMAKKLQDLIYSHQSSIFDNALLEFIDMLGQQNVRMADPAFSALLQELLSAYQRRDYLLFADLLEYKMQPLLHEVREKGIV